MSHWRQAPWPVIFAVSTALFAVLSSAFGQVAQDSSQGLPLSAPLFGAPMTWWLVRQRNAERASAGFDAGQHAAVDRAVLRGELPPDPATWPGARTLVARRRAQLHRSLRTPLLFVLIGLAGFALGAAADDSTADYLLGSTMSLVAGVGTVSSAWLRRRLDAAEAALDAAEAR